MGVSNVADTPTLFANLIIYPLLFQPTMST